MRTRLRSVVRSFTGGLRRRRQHLLGAFAAIAVISAAVACGVDKAAAPRTEDPSAILMPSDSAPSPAPSSSVPTKFDIAALPFGFYLASGSSQYGNTTTDMPVLNGTIPASGAVPEGSLKLTLYNSTTTLYDDLSNPYKAVYTSDATTIATADRDPQSVASGPQPSFTAHVKALNAGDARVKLAVTDPGSGTVTEFYVKLHIVDNRPQQCTPLEFRITAASATVSVGGTVDIVATACDAYGHYQTIDHPVQWTSSSNVSLTTPSFDKAVAKGLSPGAAWVTGTYNGASPKIGFTVVGNPLASLTLSPASGATFLDGCQDVTAVRKDANGAVTDKGGALTWAANKTDVTITSTGTNSAKACAPSAGAFTVTATSTDAPQIQGSTSLTRVVVKSISVSPSTVTVTGTGTATVVASVTLDDGSGAAVIPDYGSVSWTSSNPGSFTVTPSTNRKATVAGTGTAGTGTVTASLGGVSATANVTEIGVLAVLVVGPDFDNQSITAAGTYNWTAQVNGGVEPYSYQWQWSPDGGTTYYPFRMQWTNSTYPSTASTVSRIVDCKSPQYVRVRATVTSADGQQVYGDRPFLNTVWSSSTSCSGQSVWPTW